MTAIGSSNASIHLEPRLVSRETTLSVGAKIGIGLAALCTILIVIIGFATLKFLQRRRRLKDNIGQVSTPSQNEQLYLQEKGELEADERVKYELHAESLRPELGGENAIYEMTATKDKNNLVEGRRLELRGEEHSKELE